MLPKENSLLIFLWFSSKRNFFIKSEISALVSKFAYFNFSPNIVLENLLTALIFATNLSLPTTTLSLIKSVWPVFDWPISNLPFSCFRLNISTFLANYDASAPVVFFFNFKFCFCYDYTGYIMIFLVIYPATKRIIISFPRNMQLITFFLY